MNLKVTTANPNLFRDPMNAKMLEQMLKVAQGMPPANWLLVAPDGRVWKGINPTDLLTQISVQSHRNNIGG